MLLRQLVTLSHGPLVQTLVWPIFIKTDAQLKYNKITDLKFPDQWVWFLTTEHAQVPTTPIKVEHFHHYCEFPCVFSFVHFNFTFTFNIHWIIKYVFFSNFLLTSLWDLLLHALVHFQWGVFHCMNTVYPFCLQFLAIIKAPSTGYSCPRFFVNVLLLSWVNI